MASMSLNQWRPLTNKQLGKQLDSLTYTEELPDQVTTWADDEATASMRVTLSSREQVSGSSRTVSPLLTFSPNHL